MAAPAPSPKKMFEIKEKLLRPALTSHFQCWFNPPQSVRNWLNERGFNYNSNSEFISLSCSEATLPGNSLITNEINDDYTGVTERLAYRKQYDDRADFTFYVDHGRNDGNYNIIWFFENWISYIANEQYTLGLDDVNYNYRVQYPDNYQSPAIYINKFERDFDGQYLEYRFLQAYPISINSMPVSYDSSELLKCTVSFAYTRYLIARKTNKIEQQPGQQTATGIPNTSTSQDQQILEMMSFNNPTVPTNQELIQSGFSVSSAPEPTIRRSSALSQQQIRNRRVGL